MELFLLYLSAFLRPVSFIEWESANVFDLAAIGLTGALILAFLSRSAVRKDAQLGPIDILGVGFAAWCITAYVAYVEMANVRELARLIIPVITYTLARNILIDIADYKKMLRWMLAGLSVPIFLSTAVILAGGGMENTRADYFTGTFRWQGVYAGSHSMGHNATFFLMVAAIYVGVFGKNGLEGQGVDPWPVRIILLTTAIAALFCLGMSQVRTALLGLTTFVVVYLYFRNRKALFLFVVVTAVAAVLLFPVIKPYVAPEVVMAEKGQGDLTYIGSGRFYIWATALTEFTDLPLDQKIAGFGIGRRLTVFGDELVSHNDYMDLLLRTGIVGLLLYLLRELLLLKAIFGVQAVRVRQLFFCLFAAVVVMNMVSVSYIGRFGLGQMYAMVLAYVGLRRSAENTRPAISGSHTTGGHVNVVATQHK